MSCFIFNFFKIPSSLHSAGGVVSLSNSRHPNRNTLRLPTFWWSQFMWHCFRGVMENRSPLMTGTDYYNPVDKTCHCGICLPVPVLEDICNGVKFWLFWSPSWNGHGEHLYEKHLVPVGCKLRHGAHISFFKTFRISKSFIVYHLPPCLYPSGSVLSGKGKRQYTAVSHAPRPYLDFPNGKSVRETFLGYELLAPGFAECPWSSCNVRQGPKTEERNARWEHGRQNRE